MNNPSYTGKDFIEKITRIVNENLEDENFGVEELARLAGISRVTLYRKIKYIKDKSINQFVREIRLHRAMEILQDKKYSVSEIAYMTGFGSPTYFIKCFHDYYGFSPGASRKGRRKFFRNTLSNLSRSLAGINRRLHRYNLTRRLLRKGHGIPVIIAFIIIIVYSDYFISGKSDQPSKDGIAGGINEKAENVSYYEDAGLLPDNPMGKTWIIFIDNSQYNDAFQNFEGHIDDTGGLHMVMSKYQINMLLHKENMTKAEMERFFLVDLRENLIDNDVKSLLIMYSGYGKNLNGKAYLIPVDARLNNEFTYFNFDILRKCLESYNPVVHTLIVSEACEPGRSFFRPVIYTAHSTECDDILADTLRSAQVLSLDDHESGTEHSRIIQTFSNALIENQNKCISIEEIVDYFTKSKGKEGGLIPVFGNIEGPGDMGGTFLFITR